MTAERTGLKKRVMIADDHVVWRRGLREILEPRFQIVAEAGDGNEAVAQAIATRPDVVTMDIQLHGMDGLAAAREIREHLPDTQVVVISVCDEDQGISEAIQAGVCGYVGKADKAETMIAAVDAAAEGRAYLPPLIARRVLNVAASHINGQPSVKISGRPSLTSREIAVLRLMAEGKRHKEIAKTLSISVRTVGHHLSSIYNKLGIDDRSQAIVYAIKQGIVRV
jgi:DNA-binding NarL/FixJ family response regulator